MDEPDDSGSEEDRLIARFFAPVASAPGALQLKDDAAFLTPPLGSDLVVTTDAIVAGVHFFQDDEPGDIARKAMRVNLSDLAAKGAAPLGFLVTLALPGDTDDKWLAAFARGLQSDAAQYKCPLYGGDTVRTPGPAMISVAMFGALPSGTMVQRSGVKVGDRVFVTGTIGDAALGLRLRKGEGRDWPLSPEQREHLLSRYRLPQPRGALAAAMREYASAAMDVSDGLAGDLAKLCRVSQVSAKIDVAKIPLSDAARAAMSADASLIETILTGGDDYEIVCAARAMKAAGFRRAAAEAGVALTEIGEISDGAAAPCFLDSNGQPLAFKRAAYSHF